MKRLFSLLIALMVMLPFCASAATVSTEGAPLVDEMTTITIAVKRAANDQAKSMSDKPFVVYLEDGTNVKIEWIDLVSDIDTKVSVLLAGGKMPDMFWGGLSSGIISNNTKLFVPLNDLLPQYGQHILKFYEDYDFDYKKELTMADGNIYSLPTRYIRSESNMVFNYPAINKAWLDQLNLEVPTTTEEFLNVLCAFRDNDMNGDGDATNEVPLALYYNKWESGTQNILAWFGLTDQWYNIRDGKIEGTLNTENFRYALEYLHTMYSEKLIDQEWFSKGYDQVMSLEQQGLAGVIYVWCVHNDLGVDSPYAIDYVPILGKVTNDSYEGLEDAFTVRVNSLNPWNVGEIAITTDAENPELCLRVMDYLYEDMDQLNSMMRGPRGYTWDYAPDGTVVNTNWTTEEKARILKELGIDDKFTADMDQASLYMEHASLLTPMSPNAALPETEDVYTAALGSKHRYDWIHSIDEYQPKEQQSKMPASAELQEEFAFRTEGINTMVDVFITNSVLNGVTDESWAEFQQNLIDYDYEFYLEYQQIVFDGE